MTLPLTKTLDPADFVELAEELQVVDQHITKAAEQHPMRRWEYAMALRAHTEWAAKANIGGLLYDVGGAGSPFYWMIDPWQIVVIDPQEQHGQDLATFLHGGPRLGAAVFCLSVLEHVEDLNRFLYHLSCLVAPGGLLFLTMDYCDQPMLASDIYHFHWMRRRIFTSYTMGDLVVGPLLSCGFTHLGEADLTYHGAHVYDYSFCSLALVKRA